MKKYLIILMIGVFGFVFVSGQDQQTKKKAIVANPVTGAYKGNQISADAGNQNIGNNNLSSSNIKTSDSKQLNLSQTTTEKVNNQQTQAATNVDTIVRLGGKKILCNVEKINATTISYTKIGQSQLLEIERKEVEKVLYANGKKEIFNKPVLQMIAENNWQAVLITENPAEVQGLYKRGLVTANASSGSRSAKAAKTSATMRLQKKAAKLGALIVLITHSEMKGGYGEIPGWELEGIGYSDTPPADTAAVNKAIKMALEKRNRDKIKKAQNK
jgi:preprotein translocase subunit YajC